MDVPYCFNRKEAKSHGEGGTLVGAPLEGRVLIIDDVITAGTAIREVMAMVELADAEAVGVVIGLDRKERGNSAKSAIQEVEQQFGVPVISIINMDDILTYLESQSDMATLVEEIKTYRHEYGV
jgi:orotate phosphoribosyltransferase